MHPPRVLTPRSNSSNMRLADFAPSTTTESASFSSAVSSIYTQSFIKLAEERFLKEARAVLERTDEAVANVRVFAQAGETELHVGYTPALSAQIVSPALHAFQ